MGLDVKGEVGDRFWMAGYWAPMRQDGLKGELSRIKVGFDKG
jgi:hypothetical protein